MTIGDFSDCVAGFAEREKREIEKADYLNFLLGQYVAVAFNQPKKYPREPFLKKAEQQRKFIATTDAARVNFARIKYGGK